MIDLRSDTLSMPTPEMLQSIVTARLGDDSRDGDPTVLELEALAAQMLGKEAALLFTSGAVVLALTVPQEIVGRVNLHSAFAFDALPRWAKYMQLPIDERMKALAAPSVRAELRRNRCNRLNRR